MISSVDLSLSQGKAGKAGVKGGRGIQGDTGVDGQKGAEGERGMYSNCLSSTKLDNW